MTSKATFLNNCQAIKVILDKVIQGPASTPTKIRFLRFMESNLKNILKKAEAKT